jgi:hypothetical protein
VLYSTQLNIFEVYIYLGKGNGFELGKKRVYVKIIKSRMYAFSYFCNACVHCDGFVQIMVTIVIHEWIWH